MADSRPDHAAQDDLADFAVEHRARLEQLSREQEARRQAAHLAALTIAHQRANPRRFTGAPVTGFGELA